MRGGGKYIDGTNTLTEWASLHLCDAAMWLRGAHSGSNDPMSPEDESEVRNTLAERVANWRPTTVAKWERADNAVREFVTASLEETASRHIAPPNWQTYCGMKPGPGVLAYDLCSLDDGPGWCSDCMAELRKEEVK